MRRREKGGAAFQAIGCRRGGLSTQIHATVDAPGYPTAFYLTPGQAHDLEGADVLRHAHDVAAFVQAVVVDRMTPEGIHFDRKAAQALFDILNHAVTTIDSGRFLALVEQEARERNRGL